MLYSVTVLRTITQEGSLSGSSEGLFLRGNRGARVYRSFCWGKKKQLVVKHQKITTNHKKTDISS